ncbi:Prolyl oligopeptidase family protein [Perilla frutescens var. hirtella]|uniref:Prolyl oligopeptidase family protein n=1 Tax=Perilla frutescens var. hirtella TaxID=608512 RepID=A0AAD4JGX2_PERFH|nr:Prolyl oligopeptidase family protein [Perilla frutescens var. hirtella]
MQGQPVDHHYLLRSPVASPCSPRNWENVFAHDPQLIIVDVDFCNTHLLLIIRNGRKYGLYSLSLPLGDDKVGAFLKDFNPQSLPLPDHVSQILPVSNYDFYSSTMCVTMSSAFYINFCGEIN